MKRKYSTSSPRETKELARRISSFLAGGDVVALIGELGAGKTTFVKGVASGLGISEKEVVSPSYVLIREYEGLKRLFHFDLYRLKYLEEIELLGYEDYFRSDGINCIEWADKNLEMLPAGCLKVYFDIIGEKNRQITLAADNKRYKDIFEAL